MVRAATQWNGTPTVVKRCLVEVQDSGMFQGAWYAPLVGTEREALEVQYLRGKPFYIDNDLYGDEDVSEDWRYRTGWLKVTEGQGSPAYPHRQYSKVRVLQYLDME